MILRTPRTFPRGWSDWMLVSNMTPPRDPNDDDDDEDEDEEDEDRHEEPAVVREPDE